MLLLDIFWTAFQLIVLAETNILVHLRFLCVELIHVLFDRSAAIVIAYLMKSKGWNLAQSLQWTKERRPSVDLNQGHTAIFIRISSPTFFS